MIPSFRVRLLTPDHEILARWGPPLKAEGWPCSVFEKLGELLADLPTAQSGLALLDAEALGANGPAAVRPLRETRHPFLVFGRRGRGGDSEIIRWLEAGSDDFIESSTDGRLLLAKLRAHLRRLLPAFSDEMQVLLSPKGQMKCDRRQRRAWLHGDGAWRPLPVLTEMEFELLCLFLRNPESALERRFILEAVWQERAGEVNAETVDKHVEALRRKLGAAGRRIQTLYGVGYAFREE